MKHNISRYLMTLALLITAAAGAWAQTEAAPEVTIDDAKTTATMEMPASDVTLSYELVRDLTQQVAFSGVPTGDAAIVKKGDDGKYQFATQPDFQLIDALAAADAQNIIEATGITVQVYTYKEIENNPGHYQFDPSVDPIALADFLADAKPGVYQLIALATADGPYCGDITSAIFTLEEKYDLLVKPADEYSKDKLDAVTVGTEAQTIGQDGTVTATAAPATKVTLKAKTGYVIQKAETKKGASDVKTLQISGATTATITYAEGETWKQAIDNHPTENAGWHYNGAEDEVWFNQGNLVIYDGSTIDVSGKVIDPANKTYSFVDTEEGE